MTAAVLEFRVHERWGETLLLETSSFQPTKQDEPMYVSFVGLIQKSVAGLEALWQKWQGQFERSGISVEETGAIARSLEHALFVLGRCLDMVGTYRGDQSPSVEEEVRTRLTKLGEKAKTLLRLVNLPVPECNPERVKRGAEEVERGGGIDAEEWLSQLAQEGGR